MAAILRAKLLSMKTDNPCLRGLILTSKQQLVSKLHKHI